MQPFSIRGVKAYAGATCTDNTMGVTISSTDDIIYYSVLTETRTLLGGGGALSLHIAPCSSQTSVVRNHKGQFSSHGLHLHRYLCSEA